MRRLFALFAAIAVPALAAAAPAKLAWYVPAPHPYFDAVKLGVEAFEKEFQVEVRKQVGPDWNMDSENTGMLALAADGYLFVSAYPADASAANGLYDEIVKRGGKVVNFGASTFEPTPASFAVMTDVKDAAMKAAEFVIGKMGKKGTLVNVLEVLEDPNTKLRKEGILEVAKKYPAVKIVEVAGIKSEQEAVEKIEGAIAGAGGYVDGIITTGFVPTVALSKTLADYQGKTGKHIAAVGIDDDPVILDGISKGFLDATIAQNPFGHGYLSMLVIKYLAEGYKPAPGAYKVNAGIVLVTKGNVDSYKGDLAKVTSGIKADLLKKYLKK
ncbi:MAG TPA: sugar ABC transporter substrate-binding protein [Anaeromyxobacter sp.]|nr:sugar ABC transporter substrate-binding protein [Anaeromyxobacter sp.]HVP59395.1 sugar ABC transporter substrate-binding protein [Myxococcaceae bacterium]